MMKKRKVLEDEYAFFDHYAELMSNSLSLSIPFSRLFRIISANAIDINKKFEIKIRPCSYGHVPAGAGGKGRSVPPDHKRYRKGGLQPDFKSLHCDMQGSGENS